MILRKMYYTGPATIVFMILEYQLSTVLIVLSALPLEHHIMYYFDAK